MELEQDLITSVQRLEAKFGRRWWKDPDHKNDYSNLQRLLWLKEHNDNTRFIRSAQKPQYLYEFVNLKTGETSHYTRYEKILKEYTVTGKPLDEFVVGKKYMTVDEAYGFFKKHGYLLRKVLPE